MKEIYTKKYVENLTVYSGAHNLNVRSYDALATYFWSGDMVAHMTLLSWPDSVFKGVQPG